MPDRDRGRPASQGGREKLSRRHKRQRLAEKNCEEWPRRDRIERELLALEDAVDVGRERLRVQKAKTKQRKREHAAAVSQAEDLMDANRDLYAQIDGLRSDLQDERYAHFCT